MAIVICGTALILATIFSPNVAADEMPFQDNNRKCIPAEGEPTLNSNSCYPLVNFTRPFCQNQGIKLDNYVFKTPDQQIKKNDKFNEYFERVSIVGVQKISQIFKVNVSLVRKCISDLTTFVCRYFFPRCDRTSSVFKEQKLCRESCNELSRSCDEIFEMVKMSGLIKVPKRKELYNCELQPNRNAGDSPECWYYNKFSNLTDRPAASESTIFTDCLHGNGSSYQGNISVTASGIPCQSWTAQCPHRHTMNRTYPELNLAKNYCRNPQNSGKRPWCFTTDRNKRWEYCVIPKCTPVDGNYGNWTPQSTCNVSCGQGFEIWKRECINPEPKYGGKNCSHLGEAVQYRPCFEKNCPVNGGYGNWTLGTACNVSCGVGIEIWRRGCDNPEPKYGGSDCSEIGDSIDYRKCSREPCPIDGNYSNWTRSSSCSATCGKGIETWTRQCDNPPGKYGGNCSKQGSAQQLRTCAMAPCPAFFDTKMIGIITGSAVFVLVLAVSAFLVILRRRRRRQGSSNYTHLNSFPRSLPSPQEADEADSSQETDYDQVETPPTSTALPSSCGNFPTTKIA